MKNVKNACIEGENEMVNLLEEVQQILHGKADLNKHRKKLTESFAKILYWTKEHHDFEEYYNHFANMLTAMQDFDFSQEIPQQESENILDLVASGVNILNQEFREKAFSANTLSLLIQLAELKNTIVIVTDTKGVIRFAHKDKSLLENEIETGISIGKLLNNEQSFNDIEVKKCIQEVTTFTNTDIKCSVVACCIQNDNKTFAGTIYLIKGVNHNNNINRTSELYKIAHHLLSPLSSVSMIADCIREDMKRVIAFSSLLQGSATNLKEIIEENYICLNSSVNFIENRLINFDSLIKQILDLLAYTEGFHEIDFKVHTTNKKKFYSVYFMIYGILQSLIINSIKYRKVGEPNTVQISVKDTEHGVQLRIINSAIMMTKEPHKKLFNEGKELELSLVKEYVNKLKGELTLTSTLDKPTSITIQLPTRS